MSETYNKEQVLEASIEYFNGDTLAADAWLTKHCLKGEEGEPVELTPRDMHRRLAKEFARIEANYPNGLSEEEIFEYLDNFRYIVPQGSPMHGIGNPRPVSLSNCTVIASPEDTMSSIIDAGRAVANLSKRRCGVGLDLSKLRPEGLRVNNSANTTSGAWSFAEYFSFVGRMVGQGGRRAALMITMDVRHPDIYQFVRMKADLVSVTGANVSVKLTDEFMEAALNGEEFVLQWPIDAEEPVYTKTISAKDLLHEISDMARKHAEPGVVFWDRLTQYLPAHSYEGFETISLNPCLPEGSVLLKKGVKDKVYLKDVDIGDEVWSKHGWSQVINKWSTGIKEVFEYVTNKGTFRATRDHKIFQRGERICVGDADSIDICIYGGDVETVEIVETRLLGRMEVFNITVDNETNSFWCDGFHVSNCAEIALSANDSCRLISNNLKHLVINPFTNNAYFDFDKFEEVVRVATRLADDLVDLELEKVEQIIELADTEDEKEMWRQFYQTGEDGRRVGIGLHGLADCLARLGLKYDSDEAIDLTRKISHTLRDAAYLESVNLAKERGSFPVFDWEVERDNKYIQTLPQIVQDEIKKYGRRNISLLTCAPTGTVSLLSQTSSGVEPVFRNSYIRRRKLDHDSDIEPDFIDAVGDKWIEYEVFHHNVNEYLDEFGEELPEYFVTSDEIDWEKRVQMQAALGSGLDHSISSTVNLPRGTTTETVFDIYVKAWREGLKGITVYVDGSRDGVLLTGDEETASQPNSLLDALEEVGYIDDVSSVTDEGVIVDGVVLGDKLSNGPTKIIKREGGKFYIHMSYLPNDIEQKFPVALWINSNYKGDREWIAMNRAIKSVYTLITDSGVSSELAADSFAKAKDDTHHVRLGRAIAMAMRHNIALPKIVNALENIEGDYVATTLSAVRKFLREAVVDGQEVIGRTCEDCGGTLIYEEGCDRCLGCGSSGCS